MYSVTKRIDFCYGHRLLDYDGICKHPHGHNAVAEIEVRTGTLDNRNMVCDFSDIKRIVKGWIDRELDHKMILRHDDPLVKPLQQLGEPMYLLDSNPTVERIARLIFDYATEQRLAGRPRDGLGDAHVFCGVRDLKRPGNRSATRRPGRLRSRRHARRLPTGSCGRGEPAASKTPARRLSRRTRSAGWSATAPPRLSRAFSRRLVWRHRAMRLRSSLAFMENGCSFTLVRIPESRRS